MLHLTAQQRIEEEFDEPLPDIIMVMRKQSCSWTTIAGALDVSRGQVYLWRKKFDIQDNDRICDMPAIPKIETAARQIGYQNAEKAIIDLRFGGHTLAETAEKLGVDPHTVTRHYPPGFSGLVFIKTDKYLNACRCSGLAAARRRASSKRRT